MGFTQKSNNRFCVNDRTQGTITKRQALEQVAKNGFTEPELLLQSLG
jgi:hypothetical protein